mgnify:CR=1 FL=1
MVRIFLKLRELHIREKKLIGDPNKRIGAKIIIQNFFKLTNKFKEV